VGLRRGIWSLPRPELEPGEHVAIVLLRGADEGPKLADVSVTESQDRELDPFALSLMTLDAILGQDLQDGARGFVREPFDDRPEYLV
jgi:hypothetical protein